MHDELSEEQKVLQTHAAFKEFADQFGENDIIKDIFLDILLEAIYNETNDIPLPSETRQGQHEDRWQAGDGAMPCYTIE